MAEDTPAKLYVAREDDLATLRAYWAKARSGTPSAVLLEGPLGAGKRALTGELARLAVSEDDDTVLWRVAFSDEQDGLQTLIRLYAGLYQALFRSPLLRGKVEMALNSQMPTQPKRVQQWYQAFVEGLKKGAPPPGQGEFQVILPRDNPLVGIVEIALGIARKFPVLLEVQNLQNTQSLAVVAMLEALLDEALHEDEAEGSSAMKLLAILAIEPVDEAARAWYAMPLLDMLDRRKDDLDVVRMQGWGADEVQRYLESKQLPAAGAADIARIAGGRPGYVAELVDHLQEQGKLESDLSGLTMANLIDITPDADELDEDDDDDAGSADGDDPTDEAPQPGKRRPAKAADAARVAYLAALLGLSFPSGLVADMAAFERDSVDDLLDATPQLYKELQFSQPLGTWVYQFHKALHRESVLARHTAEEDRELARRVGVVLENNLAPRGYAYLLKTLRLYGEFQAGQRAAILRSLALGADQPQVWAMAHDLVRYFDDITWPDPLRRTVYMHLMDRMTKAGDVNQAEQLFGEAMKWAQDHNDRPLQGWLLHEGSQLDLRRQDLYRARDRANDALRVFGALEDKLKQAEIRGHLALIELQDGNPNAALDQARLAEEIAPVPPIQAQTEYVRGLVARRDRAKLQQAIEHFRKANEIAGRARVAGLAVDSGLNMGETLLLAGQAKAAAEVLAQVAGMAQGMQNSARERGAVALLAQAHASLKAWEPAKAAATRALELTRALKFERFEAADLYNLAFFNLQLGHATEAVSLFQQARERASAQDAGFQKELLFHLSAALLRTGDKAQAAAALQALVAPATAAKDWAKLVAANGQLATLAEERKDLNAARTWLTAAIDAAEKGGLKEEHKGLRKRLTQLG